MCLCLCGLCVCVCVQVWTCMRLCVFGLLTFYLSLPVFITLYRSLSLSIFFIPCFYHPFASFTLFPVFNSLLFQSLLFLMVSLFYIHSLPFLHHHWPFLSLSLTSTISFHSLSLVFFPPPEWLPDLTAELPRIPLCLTS